MASLRFVLFAALCIQYSLAQNCSSFNSYVQVNSPESMEQTLNSAMAQFSPFSYSVDSTQVAAFNNGEDICSQSTLTTDVTDKIVLILPWNAGNCTDVYKVYVAEQSGAKAVLLAQYTRKGNAGSVTNIVDDRVVGDDGEIISPTIPSRMIAYNAAKRLFKTIKMDGDTVEVEFGCYDDSETLQTLCMVDRSGDHWWLDGDFTLQADITKNDHPVWIKKGYLLVLDVDFYLFLDDGDGKEEPHWAITEDPEMEDPYYKDAYCANTSISNPMDCEYWYLSKYYIDRSMDFYLNDEVNFNNSQCSVTDNTVCIRSNQSTLAGLSGTYRQFSAAAPIWVRDFTDCDTMSGYFRFIDYGDSGEWILIDPHDAWEVAHCYIDADTFGAHDGWSEYVDQFKFHPELCTEWNTLVDGSLDSTHLIYDSTMKVTQGSCDDAACDSSYDIPDTVCMGKNSIMHSFLEGEYVQTGERGNRYNTSVWQRSEDLFYDDEFVPVYMWYYGEISNQVQWWVIAASNYSTAKKNNGSQVYGYCPSITSSPSQCTACWNFYFSEENYGGAWHGDCSFSLDAGSCSTEAPEPQDFEWPEYLCIDESINNPEEIDIEWSLLKGGYQLVDNFTKFSGDVPYWVKPPNDYNGNHTYIYYDAFYGYWQVGQYRHVDDAYIFCMEAPGEYLPTHCSDWYDHHAPPHSLGHGFIFTENCGESNMLTISVKNSHSQKAGLALLILLLLALVVFALATFIYWKHHQKKVHKAVGTLGRRESVELGDDVDKVGLVNHHTTGGMDMSPIYTEGNGIAMDHSADDDDLDEDYTADKTRSGIVDPDDEGSEEELMRQTLGGDDDDELRMPEDQEEDPDLDEM